MIPACHRDRDGQLETWGSRGGPTPILGGFLTLKLVSDPNPQIANELAKTIRFEQSRVELVKS